MIKILSSTVYASCYFMKVEYHMDASQHCKALILAPLLRLHVKGKGNRHFRHKVLLGEGMYQKLRCTSAAQAKQASKSFNRNA